MAKATDKGRQLLAQLVMADPSVPRSHNFVVLLSLICRAAATKQRLAVEHCNYEWASSDVEEAKRERCRQRIKMLSVSLATEWPGASLEQAGDPRGYVVRLVPPNGRGGAWAGGVGVA